MTVGMEKGQCDRLNKGGTFFFLERITEFEKSENKL